MAFEELKERMSTAWGAGSFEKLAERGGDAQDELVERLAPQPGDRWLDVATGTGAVAIRAARAGADVTGVDFAVPLLETAQRLAAEEGLAIRYETGDAEALPVPDASFDVVSSSFGAMFAPDHRRTAAELARVCRNGGRLGLLTWLPEGAIGRYFRLLAEYQPPMPQGAGSPLDWGREEHVRELLGDAFELEFATGVSTRVEESAEELWQMFVESFGPLKVLVASLEPPRREQLHDDVVAYFESYRETGGIIWSREYLITLGRRR